MVLSGKLKRVEMVLPATLPVTWSLRATTFSMCLRLMPAAREPRIR